MRTRYVTNLPITIPSLYLGSEDPAHVYPKKKNHAHITNPSTIKLSGVDGGERRTDVEFRS